MGFHGTKHQVELPGTTITCLLSLNSESKLPGPFRLLVLSLASLRLASEAMVAVWVWRPRLDAVRRNAACSTCSKHSGDQWPQEAGKDGKEGKDMGFLLRNIQTLLINTYYFFADHNSARLLFQLHVTKKKTRDSSGRICNSLQTDWNSSGYF